MSSVFWAILTSLSFGNNSGLTGVSKISNKASLASFEISWLAK